jgi:2',3'-cyclic-nucleotide 2'-phosphodiesterase (5'-nucleotidase family)
MVKRIKYLLLIIFASINFIYAIPEEIWIVHVNDIHGALAPSDAFWMNPDFPPPIGNAPAAITVINKIKAEAAEKNIPVLLFDIGDWFSGTPVGDFTYGKSVIEFLNHIKIDATVVGNHDFSFGLDTLQSLIRMLDAPVLCANLVKTGTDSIPEYFIPTMILNRDGLKIGLFGITTHYLTGMVSPEHMAGLEVLKHYVGTANCVSDLRNHNADIIIGLTHAGFSHDERLADSVPGIDVIIGGHSHTGVQPPREMPRYHTIIQQAYSRLTAVGVLKLRIDQQTKRIANYEGELINLFGEEQILDKDYLGMLANWQEAVETGFDNVLGTSKRELTRSGFEESPVGNLITDAMREYAQADIAVTNSGGIRANLSAGNITYRDLYKVENFGNTIVSMTMNGAQIWRMLEVSVIGYHAIFQVSGLKMVYDRKAQPNQRIISVEIDGQPIDTNKVYKIATNNFLAAGGGAYGIFKEGKDVDDTYTLIRDVMAQYIIKHSPIDYKIEGRIIAKKS